MPLTSIIQPSPTKSGVYLIGCILLVFNLKAFFVPSIDGTEDVKAGCRTISYGSYLKSIPASTSFSQVLSSRGDLSIAIHNHSNTFLGSNDKADDVFVSSLKICSHVLNSHTFTRRCKGHRNCSVIQV